MQSKQSGPIIDVSFTARDIVENEPETSISCPFFFLSVAILFGFALLMLAAYLADNPEFMQ